MWKEIDGFVRPYRINDMGVVQSYYNKKWRTMTPQLGTRSRATVHFEREDGTRKAMPISRMMADAFMGGQREGMCIVHKDGDKLNNCLWNLKFEPQKKASSRGGRARRKPVVKIDRDGNELEIYPSAVAAAKDNFISPSAVTARCRGERKQPFRQLDWDFRYEDRGVGQPKKRKGKA